MHDKFAGWPIDNSRLAELELAQCGQPDATIGW